MRRQLNTEDKASLLLGEGASGKGPNAFEAGIHRALKPRAAWFLYARSGAPAVATRESRNGESYRSILTDT
jgi:hypothetical protein